MLICRAAVQQSAVTTCKHNGLPSARLPVVSRQALLNASSFKFLRTKRRGTRRSRLKVHTCRARRAPGRVLTSTTGPLNAHTFAPVKHQFVWPGHTLSSTPPRPTTHTRAHTRAVFQWVVSSFPPTLETCPVTKDVIGSLGKSLQLHRRLIGHWGGVAGTSAIGRVVPRTGLWLLIAGRGLGEVQGGSPQRRH